MRVPLALMTFTTLPLASCPFPTTLSSLFSHPHFTLFLRLSSATKDAALGLGFSPPLSALLRLNLKATTAASSLSTSKTFILILMFLFLRNCSFSAGMGMRGLLVFVFPSFSVLQLFVFLPDFYMPAFSYSRFLL